MTPSPLLELRGLRKAYRRRLVLDDLSLRVFPGQAVAVVGPNGAGKTTLLACIFGERLPDAGEIRVCGIDPLSDPAAAAECMGSVPERPFLYGELTVRELLTFVAEAHRLPAGPAESERRRLLALLDLEGAEDLLCRELSQGMGRKVALTAALLHGPRLIVLDEALNGLDRPSVERVLRELDSRRAKGAAVLMSSHDLDLLAGWCGRGLVLATGGTVTTLEGEEWERWRRDPGLPNARPNTVGG